MIRVLVVDDHVIVRSGLEQFLAMADDIEVVGMAADGAEALALIAELTPDVVLMDLSMPGVDGVTATRRIVVEHPNTKVLVLTSFSDQRRIMDALAAGAEGYLLKHAEPDAIVTAIRALHEGGSPLDPRAARVLLQSGQVRQLADELTDRERQVLLAVRDGMSNKQIARELDISERTVKAHLTKVFQRLDVADRTQAALWATKHLPESTAV